MSSDGDKPPSEKIFFPERIRRHSKDQPEVIAFLSDRGDSRTWKELAEISCKIANQLGAIGCQKGDRVAYLGRNTIAVCEFMSGIMAAGGVLVPLPLTATEDALRSLLLDCDPIALAIEKEFLPLILSVLDDIHSLKAGGDSRT